VFFFFIFLRVLSSAAKCLSDLQSRWRPLASLSIKWLRPELLKSLFAYWQLRELQALLLALVSPPAKPDFAPDLPAIPISRHRVARWDGRSRLVYQCTLVGQASFCPPLTGGPSRGLGPPLPSPLLARVEDVGAALRRLALLGTSLSLICQTILFSVGRRKRLCTPSWNPSPPQATTTTTPLFGPEAWPQISGLSPLLYIFSIFTASTAMASGHGHELRPPSPQRLSVPEASAMKLTRGHSCVLCQQRKVRAHRD
jgi:hypothetical protein